MRYLRLLAACVVIPVVMAGCASMGSEEDGDYSWCIVGGAVAGAAAGVGVDGGIGGGLLGAASGAVLGQLLCQPGDQMMSKDSDGDGVNDDKDQCPDTPKIAHPTVDKDGCPTYSDGDHVPDYLDRCPDTPAGVKTDDFGCPHDSDGDGVPDYIDECPDTPKGTPVDEKGCPEKDEVISIITNINFDFDSASIRSDAAEKLARVAKVLKENPDVDVTVAGHTDSTGPEGYNQKLSERRAAAVRKWLTENGISGTRMSVRGDGEANPLVSNKTRAGRAVNRRVEFETN